MISLGQIKKKVKKLIVRSKSKDSYPAELLKTREGRHIEGINTDNGIPEELYPAFVRLVRALGMGDDSL